MAMGLESALPALLGGAAMAGLSAAMKPKTPDVPQLTPVTATPTAPPNAPLTPSNTAALQRARANAPTSGGAETVLTSSKKRQENMGDTIQRTTLLGQ